MPMLEAGARCVRVAGRFGGGVGSVGDGDVVANGVGVAGDGGIDHVLPILNLKCAKREPLGESRT